MNHSVINNIALNAAFSIIIVVNNDNIHKVLPFDCSFGYHGTSGYSAVYSDPRKV